MKTIVKEINLLDIEDIEKAVSHFFGEEISIADIDCELIYHVDFDKEEPFNYDEMVLSFTYCDDDCLSSDLFWDEELDGYALNGKILWVKGEFRPVNEIFSFDVSAFNSFDSWSDYI